MMLPGMHFVEDFRITVNDKLSLNRVLPERLERHPPMPDERQAAMLGHKTGGKPLVMSPMQLFPVMGEDATIPRIPLTPRCPSSI